MLSRRRYRRHKPCSRQPCVLTVDFESESRSTWFSRLCFFYNFFFFTLGEEVAKGCVKDTLPSRLSSRICPPPPPAFVSLLIATKCDQLAASPRLWALCWNCYDFFRLGRIRTIQPQSGREGEGNRGKWGRQRETWQRRDCRFKLRTAVLSWGSEGFPGWRCPNGSVLIWIHRRPISGRH